MATNEKRLSKPLVALTVVAYLCIGLNSGATASDALTPTPTHLYEPYAATVKQLLKEAGLPLPPEAEAELEALGAAMDEAFASALEKPPAPIPIGDIGVEACNGNGSCGGKYVDNRSYHIYYDNHANTTNNVCSGNTLFINLHLGNGDYCYTVTDNRVCVVSTCAEPEGLASMSADRFSSSDASRVRSDPPVYVGVRLCLAVLEGCAFQGPGA